MKRLIIVLCMVVLLMANSKTTGQSDREFQLKVHDINRVEMTISNFGKFGQSEVGSGCWWPKGSDQNYIWGAGIWFGTIDNVTGDTLVTIGYGPHGGETEYTPGLSGMSFSDPNAVIFMYPDLWPPPADTFPMAPQDHISHQDSWCCYNDSNYIYHMPGDTRPIGIEVYQTVYAWDISAIEDIIFFTHEVKNVSDHTLYDCYIGVAADCDIGNEVAGGTNDRAAGILGRWYVLDEESLWVDNLGYQWQEEEEQGWDGFPGTIGFDLLQTPFDLVVGEDKDGDGILDQYERDSSYYVNNLPECMWDVDLDSVPDWRDPSQWPQLGMTALKRFTLLFEPDIDPERYRVLAGYNFTTGIYEPYDTLPTDPDDQRFLMSSGPFDLEPDSSVSIVFAVFFANWHDMYETPDSALATIDTIAQHWYDIYWNYYIGIEEMLSSEPVQLRITVNPNPVIRHASITFSLLHSGSVSLKLYNAVGQFVREIAHGDMDAGTHSLGLNTHDLAQGSYFLILETPDGKTSRSVVVLH
jgi:hypothetical protein